MAVEMYSSFTDVSFMNVGLDNNDNRSFAKLIPLLFTMALNNL